MQHNVQPNTPLTEEEKAGHFVDRHFPNVASFLASTDAQVIHADAPQASEPRTVVVRLLDAPGATLTVTCPEWCTSDHRTEIEQGTFAADFTHRGTEVPLRLDGGQAALSVGIEQAPFGTEMRTPVVSVWPGTGPDCRELTPDGVYALADQMRAFADVLDELGGELDCARAVDRRHRGERGEGQ